MRIVFNDIDTEEQIIDSLAGWVCHVWPNDRPDTADAYWLLGHAYDDDTDESCYRVVQWTEEDADMASAATIRPATLIPTDYYTLEVC